MYKRQGIESDTLLVQSFPVNDRDSRRTDTIAMQNGSFAFNLGDSAVSYTHLVLVGGNKNALDIVAAIVTVVASLQISRGGDTRTLGTL